MNRNADGRCLRRTGWAIGVLSVPLLAMVGLAWIGSLPPEQREVLPAAVLMTVWLVVVVAAAVAAVWLYMLPSWVARKHGHRNLAALKAANILLGWTLVGWALCLVWSLMNSQRTQPAPLFAGISAKLEDE